MYQEVLLRSTYHTLPEAYQEELSEFIPIYEDAYLALENADTLEELCDGFYDFIDLYFTSMLAFSKKVNIDRYENEYSEVYGYASEDQYEALEAAKDAYCQEMELLDIFYQIDDETTKHIAILYSILNEDQF